ncbi:hypothetical protein BDV98DRAFT_561497 [Pterulicium gracile]|uniref:Uncharacterized protein n=1 Tax=Pterulicium gracile TaxID=1884261 RepID=A0A5C3QT03_9AGAR|nr:hypothetical protein BDV98DRAFT_561497 [Pterula gracilis]
MAEGIAKVCNEVLYQIFLLTTGDSTGGWDASSPPWNLAAVCRRWRTLCIGTARLWTCFEVGGGHMCNVVDETCTSSQVVILRCCLMLQRSQNLPIHVDCTYAERTCAKSMMRALTKHAHRWASLLFHPDELFTVPTFNRLLRPPVHFTALRHLDYQCEANYERMFRLGPYFDTTSLPALTSLRLGSWLGDMSVDSNSFPWAQLHHICLANYIGDQEGILALLTSCPNITHFSFSTTYCFTEDVENFQPNGVLLNELVQLEMSIPGGWMDKDCLDLVQILLYIRAPKLRRLAVLHCGNIGSGRPLDDNLVDLVTRSGCRIRSLDVTKSWEAPDTESEDEDYVLHLPRLFSKVSQDLEDLMIIADVAEEAYKDDCDDLFAEMLTTGGSSDTLFPRLSRLRIEDMQFDPILLAEVIQFRQAQGPSGQGESTDVVPLDRVEIQYKQTPDGDLPGKKHPVAAFYAATLSNVLSGCGSELPNPKCDLVFDSQYFLPRFCLETASVDYVYDPY